MYCEAFHSVHCRIAIISLIFQPNSHFFFLWRFGPTRAMTSPFLRFLDHTQRRITVGRTPLDEWSARRRDLYLTTHNTHNRQTSMLPVGFEPTISAGEQPQTYAKFTYTFQYLYWFTIYLIHVSALTLPSSGKTLFVYLAGCTMFPHLPAPIWQLYYLFPPVASLIPVFFH